MTLHDYYQKVSSAPLGSYHNVPDNDTQHSMLYYCKRHFGVLLVPFGDKRVKRVCPCCNR